MKSRHESSREAANEAVLRHCGVDPGEALAFGRFRGDLVASISPNYEAGRQESNPAFQEYPILIAYCETASDVRTCLSWAQRYGWWVTCRSGGHSTAGFSVNSGL